MWSSLNTVANRSMEYLVGVGWPLSEVIGQSALWEGLERLVHHRGPDPVEPTPLVGFPGGCEGSARQLLTI